MDADARPRYVAGARVRALCALCKAQLSGKQTEQVNGPSGEALWVVYSKQRHTFYVSASPI